MTGCASHAMTPTDAAVLPPATAAWLARQAPAVREAIRASVDFATGAVRDAIPGEPTSGALECLGLLAGMDATLPSGGYFKAAHDLLDKAGPLAMRIGVANCASEDRLRAFLSLAGTAFFGNPGAIRHFEKGFRQDSPFDDVVLYLQAELEMLDGGFPSD